MLPSPFVVIVIRALVIPTRDRGEFHPREVAALPRTGLCSRILTVPTRLAHAPQAPSVSQPDIRRAYMGVIVVRESLSPRALTLHPIT